MNKLSLAVAVVVIVSAALGCDSGGTTTPTLALSPTAAVPVPFSNDGRVALVDQDVVCVTNSYEVRVRCVGRDGSVVGVFGREGEGPGEFESTPNLLRGPAGTVGTVSVVQSPTYTEEFPNERDIAYVEANNRRYAIRMDVESYRETPKRNHLRVASLAYDDHGRLWVATERDRAVFSYFDLYVGTEYVGSAQIRDRILGYDLFGSTLAALVERAPDPDGIAWRAVDWYDIGELDLGLR